MNRLLLVLCLPCFAACLVDNSIAEDEDSTSAETRVADKAPDWCAAQCERFSQCEVPCECAADVCECVDTDVETCTADCREVVADQFLGKGEGCAQAGERWMSCVSGVACEELSGSDLCELSELEEEVCDPDDRPLETDPVGEPDFQQPVLCSGGGGGGGTVPGTGPFECDVMMLDCNGYNYGVECEQGPSGSGPPICSCEVDGVSVAVFEYFELACPSVKDINVACGWWLAEPPQALTPVQCGGAAGGGGSATACSADYGDCDDGHSYHLECTAAGEADTCVCYVDGQAQGSFYAPAGMCPTVGTSEELNRVNSGCGWYLSAF